MVAVISGSGLGLFGSSLSALGGVGASGNAGVGRGTDRAYVNTTTGNLIVQSQDERLSALGLDLNLVRTYNSQGLLDDDNGDNWRLGLHQRVYGLSGALNSSGSTVKKVFGDGREVLYTYSVDQSRYIGTDGDGAHDTLTNSDGTWTWTDGSGRNTETYNSAGQLTHSRDADGNTISYGYSGALLTQITDASGQITYLDYNGDNNLDQIRVVSNGQEQTLTRYYYDSANRLRQVVLDLSPADNTVSLPDANGDGVFESINGQTYVTTYTYDGTSRRIASITQADGSSVSFTYVQLDGQYRVRTYTDAENRTTTLTYSQPTDSAGSSNASANPAALSTTRTDNYNLNTGAMTSPAGAGTWAAAEFLETSNGANATWQSVAFDGSGNGFATWVMNGDVYARRYDAATAQWGTAVRVESSSVLSGAPQLAVDRVTGRAVLAWVQSTGLALSTYDAATSTWGAVQLVVSTGAVTLSEDYFSIAVAGNFTAVTWLQSDGTRQNLRATVSNNGVWSTPTLLETSTQTASLPQVGIDASGNALVTWRQSDGTAQRVYYSRWSHASQSFSSASLLDTAAIGTERPRLAFDGQGNAFAVWGQPDGLQVRRFEATSGTWGSVTSLQSGTAASWDMAVDAQGNALVGWVQIDGATKSAYARRFDATSGTWSTATVLESSTADVSQEKISVALAGRNAVVSWLQTNGTNNDLYAAYLTNGTWSTPQLLDGRANPAQWPYAAIDSAGNVLVVWEQVDGTGARSIYYARYTGAAYYTIPAGATWQSIANTLYGVNSAAAGSALQAAMGHPALTSGAPLSGWPSTLNVTSTVPGYYTVQSGDTWASITQAIYGTNTAQAVSALQAQLGTPTLAAGLQLTVPAVLSYGGSASAGYLQTDVQDALGLVTTYTQDSAGRLTSVRSPTVDGTRLETRYAYDTEGNVIAITQDPSGLNRVTTFGYDTRGNLMLTRDSLGNTQTRDYDPLTNQLLTQTQYLVRDPDGAGSGAPSAPETTRYVYDAESHLRFVISPEGRVTERQYNAAGQLTSTRTFTAAKYTGTSVAESDLAAWTGTLDRSYLELELYAYDFRSNVSTITRYWGTTTAGAPLGTAMVTRFVYDQRGQLLQTIDPRGEATTSNANDYRTVYTYDGLGRVLTTNEWVSSTSTRTTLNTYDDAGRITRTTLANGLVTTRTYNRAGELISVANGTASAPTALGTTTYAYDAAGRLRMQTEPTGVRQFFFYDEAGRQVAHVDGDGSLTEVVYNRAGQTIKTIQYAALLPTAVRASLVDGSGNPASVPLSTLRTAAGGNAANDRITRTVYDASGALVYTIDPSGAVVEHRYDGAGRLTDTIQYANRFSIERTMDEVLPASVTVGIHADDRRTRYFYDNDGLKIGQLDAEGYLTEYSYQGAGRLSDETRYANQSAVGVRASGTFAELKSAVGTDTETATDPERDQVTHYFYDALGRQTGVLDAEGYLTETQYDDAGNVSKRIRYDQVLTYRPKVSLMLSAVASTTVRETTAYTYDGDNKLTSEVSSRGTATESSSITTTYSYDAMGHLVSTTRAAGTSEARTTQARYDFLGRVIQELTGEGSAQLAALTSPTATQIDDIWSRYGITYQYDLSGRKISATTRPDNTQTNVTRYYYNNDGRLRFEINQLGERIEYRYNALDQLEDEIHYTIPISTTGLNGGLLDDTLIATLTSNTNPAKDKHVSYEYSLTGKVASVRTSKTTDSAEDGLRTYFYNAFGEQRLAIDHIDTTRTLQHEYVYDKRGLLTTTLWDNVAGGFNTSESRTYDAFGRLRTLTDARNVTFSYEYDRLGRELATVDGLGGRRITTYDAFSRVLTTRDALNNTTTYGYDDVSRAMTLTTPEGIVVTTVSNRHGQTMTVTAAGNVTEYFYDANGSLDRVSDAYGTLESRTYDRGGRQVTQTDARGTTTSIAYDAANRVLTRTVDSGGLALQTSYIYDGQGRMTDVTDHNGRHTRTTYDRAGRVSEVAIDPNGLNLRTAYTYDRQDHVVTVTERQGNENPRRTQQYIYDTLGRRIEEIVDPSALGGTLNLRTRYRYDGNNNVTRKIDANGHSTWYVYDGADRLTHTIDALGGVSRSKYDAENRVVLTERYATALTLQTMQTLADLDVVGAEHFSVATSAQDRRTQFIYDSDGRAIFTVDAAYGVTQRTFDANGRVTRERVLADPVGAAEYTSETQLLQALGNAAETIGAQDRVRWTAYDLRGRAVFTVDGSGAVTRNEFDGHGNVIGTTAYAQLRSTSLATDHAALETWALSHDNDAGNRVTRHWYDAANRQRFSLDAEGYLSETRYNDAGRLETRVVYAEKPGSLANATLAQVATAAGQLPNSNLNQTTATLYDAAGRKHRVTDSFGDYEQYTYDAVGNRTAYRNKAGAVWTYEYDANNRLIYERSPAVQITRIVASGDTLSIDPASPNASIVTHIQYDALGNVRFRTEAHGTDQARTTEYRYDQLGRQVSVRHPQVGVYHVSGDAQLGNGAPIARIETNEILYSEIAYDTLGNAFRSRDVAGNYSYKTYDNLGRVELDVDAAGYVTRYKYDTFGNQERLTRYARALSSALPTDGASLSTSTVSALISEDAAEDRVLLHTYDRLNRLVTVTQPQVFNFLPAAGSPGGTTFSAGATTLNEYDAFGQIVRTRRLVNPTTNTYADTYFYYDRRGLKTAQVDALNYLTVYGYDETGDLTRQVEYARPLAATPTVQGYGSPVITTHQTLPDSAMGYDRETRFRYDQLNRLIEETKAGVEYTPVGGATLATAFRDQVTTYGYDFAGNRTRVTQHYLDAAGQPAAAHTYTYYDVLGRVVALAEPSRDAGGGNVLVPLTVMYRDAYGNLVGETRYAGGAAGTVSEGTIPSAAASSTPNRTTLLLLDRHGHAIQTQDGTGASRFASYDKRGQVAKEWQGVTNDGTTDWLVTLYRYDKLGQQITVVEPQRYDGSNTISVTRTSQYNAFGEVVSRGIVDGSTTSGQQEFFHYDQAGRLWRTNSEDGVTKVYLYDLAGNATAEIRSQLLDLATSAYSNAAAVANLTSGVMRTEMRYDASGRLVEQRLPTFSAGSGLDSINATFSIGHVAGPANPFAIYQMIDYGWGSMYVVNPGATLAEGGGYYLNSAGEYVLDPGHQIVSAVRITWDAPADERVQATLEYRPLGSTDPNAWASVIVGRLPNNKLGANVSSLVNQTYEYRVSYRRRAETNAYAEATGTFRVDGTASGAMSIAQNPSDVAAEVSSLSPTYTDGIITWAAPADTSVVATFRVRREFSDTFTDITAPRSGSNFRVDVRAALALQANYDYEIVYTRAGEIIARKTGSLYSTGTSTPRVVSSSITNSPVTIFTYPVGTLAGAAGASVAAVIQSRATPIIRFVQEFPEPWDEYRWDGTNVVNLAWGNLGSGRVKVRLEYMSDSRDWGDSVAMVQEQTFASGATGATVSWSTSTRRREPFQGGIESVSRVVVYTETAPNSDVWVPRYDQQTPPSSLGKSISWDVVAGMTPSFEIRLPNGQYTPVSVATSGPRWTVDLTGFADSTYQYRVQYRDGGRLVSEQTGNVTLSSGSTTYTTSTTVSPDGAPSSPPAVGSISAQPGVTTTVAGFTNPGTNLQPETNTQPERWRWSGMQSVTVNYTALGTTDVRIIVDYTTNPGTDSNQSAQQRTYPPSGTAAATSATATSATLRWDGTSIWHAWGLPAGGIASVQRVRVYAADGVTLLRDTAVAPTSPSLSWPTPPAGVTPVFGYRPSGSTGGYTYVTPSSNGSQLSINVGGLSGTYEYWIGYQRSGESYYASGATGSFTVSGTSVTLNSQTPFNNAPTWLSGVTYSGSRVTWTQAPESGASVQFEYWNGSAWVGRAYTTSGSTFYVDMTGLSNGQYRYQIKYFRSGQSIPYIQATGTANVAVTAHVVQPSVSISMQANVTFPMVNFSGVSISGETLSWSYPVASDSNTTVKIRYTYAHTLTTEIVVQGSGPNFQVTLPAPLRGAQALSYTIDYYRQGETTPYARSVGSGFVTVNYPTIYPTVTVQSQTSAFPSGVVNIAAPQYLGGNAIAWTLLAEAGATIRLRYRHASGGNWTELEWDERANGAGYEADLAAVADGNYVYEISYTRPGEPNPYALGRGTLQVERTTTATSLVINPASSSNQPSVNYTPTRMQSFDRWGNAIAVTDAANNTTDYRFNSWNQLTQIIAPLTRVVATTGGQVVETYKRPVSYNYYDSTGRLIGTRDANGNLNRLTLNAVGQVLAEIHADGGVKSFAYNAFGENVSVVNELGFETRNTFDRVGRLVSVAKEVVLDGFTTPDPNDVVYDSFVYDEAGRRIAQVNGENETTRHYYDLHGNLVHTRSAMGANTYYEYDAQGHKIWEKDAIDGVKTWLYDYFGRVNTHADLGGIEYTYSYNRAGLQTAQTSTFRQNQSFHYDAAGHLTQINDTGVGRVTSYGYNSAGQRSHEKTVINGLVHQDTYIEYDGLGRTRGLSDLRYDLTYSYDAQGNRTHIAATYYDHQLQLEVQDLWYTYDAMNRVRISQGVNTFGQVGINASQGVRLTYDVAGQRKTAETTGPGKIVFEDIAVLGGSGEWSSTPKFYYTTGSTTERYEYDGLGRLKQMERSGESRVSYSGGSVSVSTRWDTLLEREYDKASREIGEISRSVENNQLYTRDRTSTYNDDGQLVNQVTRKEDLFTGWHDESIVVYTTDAANVVRGYTVQVFQGSSSYTSTYTNHYVAAETYLDSGQFVSSSGTNAPGSGSTLRNYNVNFELIKFSDNRDANRTRHFANGANGQALTVVQGNISNPAQAFTDALGRTNNGLKAQHFFTANGQSAGSFGQLQDASGKFKANFDVNYTAISDAYPSSVPSSVVAQAGDTLRILAARIFGDGNLWYVLAEENGLSNADSEIGEGVVIRVPNEVISLNNNSTSFKPFDASAAIGDTSPTQPLPPPPKKGCGVLAMVLVIVVAIVVTVFTAGAAAGGAGAMVTGAGGTVTAAGSTWAAGTAALSGGLAAVGAGAAVSSGIAAAVIGGAVGSAVSQGVAIATGLQDGFDWKGVALGAIGAGVTAGMGAAGLAAQAGKAGTLGTIGKGLNSIGALGQAAVRSAVTQGIGVATGVQSSFSWRDVAMAAVAAPISRAAGGLVKDIPHIGGFASDFVSSVAGSQVRRAFGGKMDTETILADAFGNALGNSIVDAMEPIALTKDQYAEMDRLVEEGYAQSQAEFNDQLQSDLLQQRFADVGEQVSAGYSASQDSFNERLQRDFRQQQFQLSLQRDIERSISNNPEFVVKVPVPRAQLGLPVSNVSQRSGEATRDPLMEIARDNVAEGWRNTVRDASYSGVDRQFADAFDQLLFGGPEPRGPVPAQGLSDALYLAGPIPIARHDLGIFSLTVNGTFNLVNGIANAGLNAFGALTEPFDRYQGELTSIETGLGPVGMAALGPTLALGRLSAAIRMERALNAGFVMNASSRILDMSEGLNPPPLKTVELWKGYLEKRGVKFEIGTKEAYRVLDENNALGLFRAKLTDIETNTFERTIFLRKDFNASEFYEEGLHALDHLRGTPGTAMRNGIEIDLYEFRAKKLIIDAQLNRANRGRPDILKYDELIKLEYDLDLVLKGEY